MAEPSIDDLFGDDEPPASSGGGTSSIDRAPPPGRGGGGLGGLLGGAPWLVYVIVAVVVFGLFWYLSSVQHERFYVEVDDGYVKVERGLFLPFGTSEHRPSRAYEPFKLPPGVEPEKVGAMTEDEVDGVLLKLFVDIARRELTDLEKGEADLAEDMLLRAGKLRKNTIADDRRLLEMMGDVAFRRGLTEIRGIQQRFDEALRQFQLAAQRGGVAYKGAQRWAEAIARLRDEFRALSRESGLDPDEVLIDPALRLGPFREAAKEKQPDGGEAEPAPEGETADDAQKKQKQKEEGEGEKKP